METGKQYVKSPAFQVYPADFLADANTLVMSAAEVGAYWLLLCVCWRENGLPDDVEELAGLARTPTKQFQVSWEKRLQRCFVKRDDGMWTHNRLEKERVKQAANREKRQSAGTKGAESRWQTDSNAIAMPSPDLDASKSGHSNRIALDGLSSSSSISSSISTLSSEQPKQQRAKRTPEMQGVRLPDDFSLNSEMREWATRETPHVDVDKAFAAFVDYWHGVPGAKGKKLDWLGTWRNRLRDLEEWKLSKNGTRTTNTDANLDAAGRVMDEIRRRQSGTRT